MNHTHRDRTPGERRGGHAQARTRTSSPRTRRITPHRTRRRRPTSRPAAHRANLSRQSTRSPEPAPAQPARHPQSPASASRYAGRPLRRARRRQGWRRAPQVAHEVCELGQVRQVLHSLLRALWRHVADSHMYGMDGPANYLTRPSWPRPPEAGRFGGAVRSMPC